VSVSCYIFFATNSGFLPAMATPGEGYSSNGLSALNSEDESSGGGKLRKRSRRSLDESKDDISWELTEDGRPKTRRVNPQRLALRLGPELVAEMEAYIVPGAKMPPFSIRKDFQERYSVDRRHIYDYFHSRGDTTRSSSEFTFFNTKQVYVWLRRTSTQISSGVAQ